MSRLKKRVENLESALSTALDGLADHERRHEATAVLCGRLHDQFEDAQASNARTVDVKALLTYLKGRGGSAIRGRAEDELKITRARFLAAETALLRAGVLVSGDHARGCLVLNKAAAGVLAVGG